MTHKNRTPYVMLGRKSRLKHALALSTFLACWLAWIELGAAQVRPSAPPRVEPPNLSLSISRQLLEAAVNGTGVSEAPIDDVIRGTRYRGVGHTAYRTYVKLVPDRQRWAVAFHLAANTRMRTRGYNDRVTVDGGGLTQARGVSVVRGGATGFSAEPAQAQATASTQINDHSYSGIIGRRAANRRVYEDRGPTEQEIGRRAEASMRAELDRLVAGRVRSFQEIFQREIRQPLLARNLFPQQVLASTTSDHLRLTLAQQGTGRYQAPPRLPAPGNSAKNADLFLQVHTSYFNNLAAGLLPRRVVRDTELAEQLQRLWGRAPEGLKPEDSEKSWAVTFAVERPLLVQFAAGRVQISLRASRFEVGSTVYPGADITVVYKIAPGTAGGWVLERIGEPEINLPDRADETPLGGRQQVFRSLLRRRFERLFPAQAEWREVVLPADWLSGKKLRVATLQAADGWLTVAGRLTSEASQKPGRVAQDSPEAKIPGRQ